MAGRLLVWWSCLHTSKPVTDGEHLMRRLLTTTTAQLIGLLALAAPLLVTAPATAAETIAIKPVSLPRGADIAGPHLDGTTIVDGSTTVKVHRPNVVLYGKWKSYYVAATGNSQWDKVKLVRISRTGTVKVLREFIDPFEARLDSATGQVAYSYGVNTQRPTIAVYDLRLKDEVSVRPFPRLPELLTFEKGLVVTSFAPPKPKTITWNTVTNEVSKLNSKFGDYASVTNNLFGYFSKDPQRGGCQLLAQLDDPGDVAWTNCDERIDAVSPDGARVATIPLLSDGIGPADVLVHRADNGKELAHYTISGYFGRVWWETGTQLLMDAFGRSQAATVRCKVAVCNRASDLRPTPDLRTVQRAGLRAGLPR